MTKRILQYGLMSVIFLSVVPLLVYDQKPLPILVVHPVADDFGIISHNPCGAPCFHGIRPGITSFDDAAFILKKAGEPCYVTKPKRMGPWTGKPRILCQISDIHGDMIGDRQIFLYADGPDVRNLKVNEINILGPRVKVTLGQLIAQYGQPDAIRTWAASPSQLGAMVYYDSLYIIVYLAMLPGEFTITPATGIGGAVYVSAATYQSDKFTFPGRIRWTGYGSY